MKPVIRYVNDIILTLRDINTDTRGLTLVDIHIRRYTLMDIYTDTQGGWIY